MRKCDYGCGQEAKHQFKNGKMCCSKNHKSCPGLSYIPPLSISKVLCPECKNLISKNRIKDHIRSCIKYNICLQCGEKTKNAKFCCSSCSALYNNKHSLKLRQFQNNKIKKGIENRGVNKCLYCGDPVNNKFCNNTCKTQYKLETQINQWLNNEIDGCSKCGHASYVKKYLLKKYKNKCANCGWGKINPHTKTLPLEVEHIDGNAYNNSPLNVTLLCPNCHSLTKTYRGANAGNGRRSYLKKYYIKDSEEKII